MAQSITVASPNGGEVWAAGSTQSVQWTASGVTGNVNIALLKAGLGLQAIAVNVPVTAGSVAWTLPVNLPAGNDYTVRVASATTGTILDVSNATFSIAAAPSIASPNGGEVWAAGSTQSIQWTSSGLTGSVNIALLKAGVGRQAIALNVPVTAGSVAWTLPLNLPAGNDYTVRIASATTGTIFDYSNAPFSITAAPSITVASPNGGEIWAAGSTQSVQWTSTGLTGNVNIALLKAGLGRQAIAVNVPVTAGSVAWTLPLNLPAGNDYAVRIASATTGTILDVSNAPFSITAAPSITVASPNGGEVWAAGSTQSVQWTSSGLTGNVNIALLKAGLGRQAIAVNVPVTAGSVAWTLPLNLPAGNDYTVRIASATTGTILDISNAAFSITAPVLNVTVSPSAQTLPTGANFQFSATVTGSANQSVLWTVAEGITGGTVDIDGLYSAPAAAGTFHVVATSVADPAKSATATVTVTAPPAGIAVAISPSATAVNLNATQQFTATVTAPAGTPEFDTSVTWTVTEGTAGGTVDNNGLYTAPGVAGVFHVVATSNADTNQSATAKVTVSTGALRTVSGTKIDNYWTANGLLQVPNDLSLTSLAALVPNADGTYTNLPGQGNADGTFTIDNVPVGNYWLVLADTNEQYLTSSDTFDLGQDFSGRPTPATCDISSNLNISNLDSILGSWLQFVVPNHYVVPNGLPVAQGNEVDFIDAVPDLAVTYAGPNLSGTCFPASALDPSQGDEAFIVQMEPTLDVPADFVGSVTGPAVDLGPLFTAAAGSTVDLTGSANSTGSLLNMNYGGADWVASFANAAGPALAPAAPDFVDISASLQPFVGNVDVANTATSSASFAVQALVPLVDVFANAGSATIGSNVPFGTVQYNDPYPTTSAWTPVYQGLADAQILSANGDSVENFFAITAPLDQTGNAAITFGPIMSTIQNPKMNGADLFTAAISNTTSVVLTWDAPSGSVVPFGYDVNYFCVSAQCPANFSGHLYTADTTVTFPPGLLAPGASYEFDIAAMADSVANIATSPLRSGYPQAWADVISAQLDIDPNAVVAQTNGVFKVIAHAAPKSFMHTKSGSFVKKGNRQIAVGSKARMLSRFNLTKAAKSGAVTKAGPVAK